MMRTVNGVPQGELVMITKVQFRNYRGFKEHELPLGKLTVVVGRNNAGKSTIVEALRLIGIVTRRYKTLPYRAPSSKMQIGTWKKGVSPSVKNMEINFDTVFHRYSDPPAEVIAHFDCGSVITVYVGLQEDKIHAVVKDPAGKTVKTQEHARSLNLPVVSVMPQVAPVQIEESTLNPDYVKGAMGSRLSSLHFRNQLNLFYDRFFDFKEAVERTWPGVSLQELQGQGGLTPLKRPLHLFVRNEDFVGELATMGHGLQMWLQAIWFLTLTEENGTVVLDEPDVYMHADLQRRLIRFLRNTYSQIILTTHSVEIMSEVEPNEILVVDKRRSSSGFASSLPAVQSLLERSIGSTHNLQVARLWHSRRFLFVEGKDIDILKRIQDNLSARVECSLGTIPSMSIGGRGNLSYAIGSSMLLKNALGENIQTYCILDSDYSMEQEKEVWRKEAKKKGIELHVWDRKELENYLLVPAAIQRVIVSQMPNGTTAPKVKEIADKMSAIADLLEDDTFDAFSSSILAKDRSLGAKGANKAARKHIRTKKASEGGLLAIVSGKEVLSRMSQWSQDSFGSGFSSRAIAATLEEDEIPQEMRQVIRAIENAEKFSAVGLA
jgi:energy-coupling factor transporter ATP-binding protein EcfA2